VLEVFGLWACRVLRASYVFRRYLRNLSEPLRGPASCGDGGFGVGVCVGVCVTRSAFPIVNLFPCLAALLLLCVLAPLLLYCVRFAHVRIVLWPVCSL
jgi:hypothetical protein